MDEVLAQIREKLEKVRRGGFRPFGFEAHAFELLPCLSEEEIVEFEAAHGVALPEGYRRFLTEICNGKAGPAYGLLPLADAFREIQLDGMSPSDFFALPPGSGRSRRKQVGGIIPLCHEGCGYFHVLVVAGPKRGQMFFDGRAGDGGLTPLKCRFLEWYDRWLDDVLSGNDGLWWFRRS